MLFSELVEAVSASRMAIQLLHSKRVGARAELGIVGEDGCLFFRTVADLIAAGHAPPGLEWADPFLAAVPTASELPERDFAVIPSRYPDGPDCPWDAAGREREAARARALARRQEALEIERYIEGGSSAGSASRPEKAD